eukprot:8270427-Karenia_brevis.AAC.1
MRALTWAGDAEAANHYITMHKAELTQRAAAVRATAKAAGKHRLSEVFPVLNREWLSWLEDSQATFNDLLRNAGQARARINHRVHAEDASLPSAHRLYPKTTHPPSCDWLRKVAQCRQGWFCLSSQGLLLAPFFCATLTGESLVVCLRQVGENRFQLDCHDIEELFQPVQVIVDSIGDDAPGPIVVDKLDLQIVE